MSHTCLYRLARIRLRPWPRPFECARYEQIIPAPFATGDALYVSRSQYASALDDFMNDLTHPDLKPVAALAQNKIAEADAWAKQMYSQYFSSIPPLTKEPIACGGDAD